MSETSIHPLAVVHPAAQIGENCEIGPFSVVGANVRLGRGVKLLSHVVVEGHTDIGADSVIYPFSSLGHAPQDLKYKGEPSRLIIGERNRIRENVTINTGTAGGGMETRVGNDCLLMVGVHVAHDCVVGNHVVMANNATLAGHVQVGDYAVLGGLSAVHQFVRIGAHAMIGGMSGIEQDVIPYGLVMGERARLAGLNLVGLERRGFEREAINRLRQAFKEIFLSDERPFAERLSQAEQAYNHDGLVHDVLQFINNRGNRSICLAK
ncbi:MAG: acyl-ACP--UDP-N-acetylglucosamine O-acyltransferase [Alphaproteobacteria bacterium]